MSLREYTRKRKFDETPEPADGGRASRDAQAPIFVVQLHHARARHYDFRLEADGTLKSWAVPKGPSLRPGEQRLAVEVEDHPISYAGFAGDIPAGHYGAGHVDIFDHGTWQPEEPDPLKAIAAGKLDFELYGEHLRGRWTLVRTRRSGSKNQWLLMKRSDAEARDAEADDFLDPAMRKATAKWRGAHGQAVEPSNDGAADKTLGARRVRDAPATKTSAKGASKAAPKRRAIKRRDAFFRKQALALEGARDAPLPPGFQAQLAMQQPKPPAGMEWLHETKWDGYRLLAELDDGKARLRSRNDLDWTERLPMIVRALEALPLREVRLDGELVVLDTKGDSDFTGLQQALKDGNQQAMRYVLFDMPGVAGVDISPSPLRGRKALLEQVLEGADPRLQYSTHIEGHGAEIFAASGHRGLEGIVSKRVGSIYAFRRSPDWLKIKHAHTDEFVIVGYTPPQGSREGFGALLLAANEHGTLRYVGRMGTGFDDAQLRALTKQLKALAVANPVVEIPAHVPLPKRRISWVRPELVIEVAFRGWASQGLLRQASFLRMREDKTVDDLDLATSTAAPTPKQPSTRKTARPSAASARARAKKTTSAAAKKAPTKQAVAASAPETVITHASRIVYPDAKLTKGDVAAYYTAVAPWILPELINRPLSLLRCPQGAGGECFFQKHHAATLGSAVQAIPLKEKESGVGDYVYIKDLQGLIELVQMNTLEFHPWGARVDKPDSPDRFVLDLDPAPEVQWKAVVAAAREIRARLDEAGLASFVRTSGGKGLHVVVPFRRGPSWQTLKDFCESFAQAMVAMHPLHYVSTASKALRKDKIFIDWLRNARGATSVCSWSLRARAGAPVAMPLRWEELGRVGSGSAYDMAKALKRANGLKADPWEGFGTLQQRLPKL